MSLSALLVLAQPAFVEREARAQLCPHSERRLRERCLASLRSPLPARC
jgi:hypothetical protein